MEESGRWGWWGGKDDQVDDKRIGERREAERQGGVDWRQTVCVCVCVKFKLSLNLKQHKLYTNRMMEIRSNIYNSNRSISRSNICGGSSNKSIHFW